MQKIFIILGAVFILIGLLWPLFEKFHLGHLPGDIFIKKGNVNFYFPIVTCIIISLIISILLWIFKK